MTWLMSVHQKCECTADFAIEYKLEISINLVNGLSYKYSLHLTAEHLNPFKMRCWTVYWMSVCCHIMEFLEKFTR